MQQRVSLITLGVADVGAARAFYERLGWHPVLEVEETVFFQAGGSVLALWGRRNLAADSGVTDGGGWGGVALAHNVGSPEDVDRIIAEAGAAGARIGREPAKTAWGGYTDFPQIAGSTAAPTLPGSTEPRISCRRRAWWDR